MLYLAVVIIIATIAFHGEIYRQNSLLPGLLLIKRATTMGKFLLFLWDKNSHSTVNWKVQQNATEGNRGHS